MLEGCVFQNFIIIYYFRDTQWQDKNFCWFNIFNAYDRNNFLERYFRSKYHMKIFQNTKKSLEDV